MCLPLPHGQMPPRRITHLLASWQNPKHRNIKTPFLNTKKRNIGKTKKKWKRKKESRENKNNPSHVILPMAHGIVCMNKRFGHRVKETTQLKKNK